MRNLLISFLIILVLICANRSYSSFKPITVIVIDSGMDLYDPELNPFICNHIQSLDFTNTTIQDTINHGKNVMRLIHKHAGEQRSVEKYCMVMYKFYNPEEPFKDNGQHFLKALRYAKLVHPDIINISAGGSNFEQEELNIIKSMPKTKFIVASGNDNLNLDDKDNEYYPCSYNLPNLICVGSLDNNGQRSIKSNYGKVVKLWRLGEYIFGSGTSFATPVVTGELIQEMIK